MATEVLLPQWGMEMQDGTIVKWLKKEGDTVEEGEPLVEVETAKLETEMESIASGVVAHILVPEGATVPIRTTLAIIASPGEDVPRPAGVTPPVAAPAAAQPPVSPAAAPGQPAAQVVPAARRLAQQQGIDLAQIQGTGPGGRILIEDVQKAVDQPAATPPERVAVQVVPAARRLAQQHGIDLARVTGTGPRGRIIIQDVEKAVDALAAPAAQVLPISGIRQTIASRMLESTLSMAQVTLTTEADVTDAMRLREGLSRQLEGSGLSPLHLVVKATARALREHPRMNAIQKEHEIELAQEVNIGVAVSLPDGLIVPTIRRAR